MLSYPFSPVINCDHFKPGVSISNAQHEWDSSFCSESTSNRSFASSLKDEPLPVGCREYLSMLSMDFCYPLVLVEGMMSCSFKTIRDLTLSRVKCIDEDTRNRLNFQHSHGFVNVNRLPLEFDALCIMQCVVSR